MATQILDTEKDIALKHLHYAQRTLYLERFVLSYKDEGMQRQAFETVKYWRARYNAACAVEQAREEETADLDFSIALDELRY